MIGPLAPAPIMELRHDPRLPVSSATLYRIFVKERSGSNRYLARITRGQRCMNSRSEPDLIILWTLQITTIHVLQWIYPIILRISYHEWRPSRASSNLAGAAARGRGIHLGRIQRSIPFQLRRMVSILSACRARAVSICWQPGKARFWKETRWRKHE